MLQRIPYMIDPFFLAMISMAITFFCAYQIGKGDRRRDMDEAIENTIIYMVQNDFVKWSRDKDGEIELHKIYEEPVTKISQLEK